MLFVSSPTVCFSWLQNCAMLFLSYVGRSLSVFCHIHISIGLSRFAFVSYFMCALLFYRDWMHLFFPLFFTRETCFVISCFHSCTPIPFSKVRFCTPPFPPGKQTYIYLYYRELTYIHTRQICQHCLSPFIKWVYSKQRVVSVKKKPIEQLKWNKFEDYVQ